MFAVRQVVVLACSLVIISACASTQYKNPIPPERQRAIKFITDTAEKICDTPVILKNDEEFKFEINGLITKIVGLGIEIKKKGPIDALQNDLASIIKYNIDCKKEIFNKLYEELLKNADLNSPFQYQVTVQDGNTQKAISHALVTIEAPDSVLADLSDAKGYAKVLIDANYRGKRGRLIVESEGYEIYKKKIDLCPIDPSKEIRLNRYSNKLGLAMGYTRFKEMDDVTYTMVGVAYAHRLLDFNLFDFPFHGYLDLTGMTNFDSEKTFESDAMNTEFKFDHAYSASISYVQSVLFGKGFNLLLKIGYQYFDIDMKVDDDQDKLIKRSVLIGGGLEYNYKCFFVQTNLDAVIGEDKNLGHDLDASIKTGINF